ncbi:MAG: DUF3108 domain-containing protein [Gammaproteobacteria bacterium]|nr:MAG: DUF3108 domain-containing protein [Gammaproteobacteria bacterium]
MKRFLKNPFNIRLTCRYVINGLILVGIALLAGPLPLLGAEENVLAPFEAEYLLKRGSFTVGSMHRRLYKDDKGYYIFESSARPRGLLSLFTSHEIHEKSRWYFDQGKIISQRYEYISGSRKKRKASTIEFHPDLSNARGTYKGRPWVITLPEKQPIYDRANYQLALVLDIRNKREPLDYLFIKKGKIKNYRFKRTGHENINTPAGHFRTTRIERVGDKRKTTIWLARELNYMPVKLEQDDEDGAHYTLLLKSFHVDTP